MAADVLTVWNQALSALGTSSSIAATTEVGREAEQCNLWYDYCRLAVFRAAPWASLTGYRRVATQSTRDIDSTWVSTDPPPGWMNAFALPSDFVRARHLSSFAQFELTLVGDVPVIACNEDTPVLAYTRNITRVDLWDPDLMSAVVYYMAAHMAKSLTGNNADVGNMFQLAQDKVLVARQHNINQQNVYAEPMPSWLQARGNNLSMPSGRYIYPAADLTVPGSFT